MVVLAEELTAVGLNGDCFGDLLRQLPIRVTANEGVCHEQIFVFRPKWPHATWEGAFHHDRVVDWILKVTWTDLVFSECHGV